MIWIIKTASEQVLRTFGKFIFRRCTTTIDNFLISRFMEDVNTTYLQKKSPSFKVWVNYSNQVWNNVNSGSFLVLLTGVITKWLNRKDWKDNEQHPHHNVACEQALWGSLAAGREKEGELAAVSLKFEFHLEFPCSFLSSELSVFPQSALSGNDRDCRQALKNTC